MLGEWHGVGDEVPSPAKRAGEELPSEFPAGVGEPGGPGSSPPLAMSRWRARRAAGRGPRRTSAVKAQDLDRMASLNCAKRSATVLRGMPVCSLIERIERPPARSAATLSAPRRQPSDAVTRWTGARPPASPVRDRDRLGGGRPMNSTGRRGHASQCRRRGRWRARAPARAPGSPHVGGAAALRRRNGPGPGRRLGRAARGTTDGRSRSWALRRQPHTGAGHPRDAFGGPRAGSTGAGVAVGSPCLPGETGARAHAVEAGPSEMAGS